MTAHRRPAGVLALALASTALAGCALDTGDDASPSGSGPSGSDAPTEVVVATHDSWAAPKGLIKEFTRETGYTVKIVRSGDAGQLTNRLVLTQGNPTADAVFGIDNTFASRAVEAGVLADRSDDAAPLPDGAERYALDDPAAAAQLTPVDWGDVCVNVDDAWFREHDQAPPRTLDDLTDPAYRDLFVTPGAATSSPGFAFLLATVAAYGEDGWEGYWKDLLANGAKVTSGWTDAYEVDFTAGGGDGERPVVLSYSSSPPFTIPEGSRRPTTSALLDTCSRQVEYAGVLDGAANPAGAQAFVDFLETRAFQESLPDTMYVYPVRSDARLPKLWARWAPAADEPLEVDPATVSAQRDDWLRTWGDLTTR